MSLYTYKYLKEEAEVTPEDITQGPDAEDISSPLEKIEDAVLASHDDEVEDALEGNVGEPLEEAYMAVYESEYNHNQLLRALGLAELNEASMGNILVLEDGDKKSFFARVKEILSNLWTTIVKAYKKVMSFIGSHTSTNKRLAAKYADQIKKGASEEWDFEGYDFKKDIDPNDYFVEPKDYVDDIVSDMNTLASMEENNNNQDKFEPADNSTLKIEIISNLTDGSIHEEDFSKAVAYVDEKLRGGVKQSLKNIINANDILDILKSDGSKVVKKAYDEIKKKFDNAYKLLSNMEKFCEKSDSIINKKTFAIAHSGIERVRICQQINTLIFPVLCRIENEKMAQARRLALKWIGKQPEDVAVGESAIADRFSSIKMI